MRKLILKALLLLIIIIIVNQAIISFLPFTWAEQTIDVKYHYYQDHAEQYNTLFIGSSTTHRHISPQLFDQSVDPALEIRSFNLGAPSYFHPKTEMLYQEILKRKPANLKYVVLEFREPRYWIGQQIFHTSEMKYWVNREYLETVLPYIYTLPIGRRQKLSQTGKHLVHLTEKNLNIGLGVDIINFLTRDDATDMKRHLGQNLDGFYTLDEEISEYPQEKYFRRYDFVRDNPESLEERRIVSQRYLDSSNDTSAVNPTLWSHIQSLVTVSEAHDIQLILLLIPRLEEEYEVLLPVVYQLPTKNKIELADPTEFPEFYSMAYTFDRGHFNKEGATLYTQALARKFNQLFLPNKQMTIPEEN